MEIIYRLDLNNCRQEAIRKVYYIWMQFKIAIIILSKDLKSVQQYCKYDGFAFYGNSSYMSMEGCCRIFYSISTGEKVNAPLKIDFTLETKCYAPNKGVVVKEMSRLISRIRYRRFWVMITTSYVDKQAYQEVVEDGHPILIVTATDIAGILCQNAIDSSNADD